MLLYRSLGEGAEIPATKRHYDYQLWGINPTQDLNTVQPWDPQPAAASLFYKPEEFQLQAPPGADLPPPGHLRKKHEKKHQQDSLPPPWSPLASYPQSQSQFWEPLFQVPGNRGVVDDGAFMRKYSWAHPLDVHMRNEVPVNAPPIDLLLDLRKDSLPTVSLSVLTPTEVRRLQRDYASMRNLLLGRVERCPYPDCEETFPVDEWVTVRQHLEDRHTNVECNFGCGQPLFKYWPPNEWTRHFLENHSVEIKWLAKRSKRKAEEDSEEDSAEEQPERKRTRKTPAKKPEKNKDTSSKKDQAEPATTSAAGPEAKEEEKRKKPKKR